MDIEEFHRELDREIIEHSNGQNSSDDLEGEGFKESSFTEIFTEDLAFVGILESPIVCHFEEKVSKSDVKISAYSIPEEDTRIDIVISDYRASKDIEKLTSFEIDKKVSQAIRAINFAFNGGYQSLDGPNEKWDMLKAIFDRKDDIDRVNIILISNAVSVARNKAVDKIKLKIDGLDAVFVEVWDLERYSRFRASGSSLEPIEVDLTEFYPDGIKCLSKISEHHEFSTTLAIVPGRVLYDLYNKYGSRLLELNVRSYLQAKGKINKEILNTLLTAPEKFLTYNNGITVVAEGIEYSDDHAYIRSIKGLQIVNGGQTTASIHRAVKENKATIENVFVQAKITIVPPSDFEEVVPLISKYSNSQNKVSDVDLKANSPFHVGVERVSKVTWAPGETSMWFYERARGGYQTERANSASSRKFDIRFPSNQLVTKEDIARYCNIWNGYPDLVSKGGQKNFAKFMEDIGGSLGKGWEPSPVEFKELIAKAIFYRSVQDVAKELKIPGYRINIVNYTASLIVEKAGGKLNLLGIWDRQGIPEVLRSQITSWLPLVQELMLSLASRAKNTGEEFKKEEFLTKFRQHTKDWEIDQSVIDVGSSVSRNNYSVSRSNDSALEACLEMTAKEWFEITAWGKESGLLSEFELNISGTMISYANLDWKKQPSDKQLKWVALILDKYSSRSN
jgi:hypothetical protein